MDNNKNKFNIKWIDFAQIGPLSLDHEDLEQKYD